MKYIDADRLKAEIERYKQGAAIARFDNVGENADYFQGKVDLCDDLMYIITSLQQEQPEVPHYKPSKEQMGALNYAYCELFKREDVGHNILGPLQNLIDTLSKL
jgi:hypothetical protein